MGFKNTLKFAGCGFMILFEFEQWRENSRKAKVWVLFCRLNVSR
jgi:hypothetical protein